MSREDVCFDSGEAALRFAFEMHLSVLLRSRASGTAGRLPGTEKQTQRLISGLIFICTSELLS